MSSGSAAGRSWGGTRTRVESLRRSYRGVLADLTSPLPTVRLELGRTLPGWAARLLLVVPGLGVLVVLRPTAGLVVVLAGVLVALVLRPNGSLAAVWCGVCGLAWTLLPSPVGPMTFALLALVPAVSALATTLGPVPLRARVEVAALRPGLLRYVVVQAVSQPVVGAALALRARQLDQLGVAVAAAAAAAVLAWVLLPRLTTD